MWLHKDCKFSLTVRNNGIFYAHFSVNKIYSCEVKEVSKVLRMFFSRRFKGGAEHISWNLQALLGFAGFAGFRKIYAECSNVSCSSHLVPFSKLNNGITEIMKMCFV